MSEVQDPPRKLPAFRKTEQDTSPKKTFKSLAILFVLICFVFLTIFWGIGWIAREDLSSTELYSRSLDGRSDSKRMTATEWARRLHLYDSRNQHEELIRLSPDPVQAKRLAEVVRKVLSNPSSGSEAPDSVYLGALTAVIGFGRFAPAASSDLGELLILIPQGEWAEVQIPLVLALARLRRPLTPELQIRFLKVLNEEDPALRKVGVFAVGALAETSESREFFKTRVLQLANDPISDVRWNAGFSLARWGDAASKPVLSELMELASRVRRDGSLEAEDAEVLTESLLHSFAQAFQLVGQSADEVLKQKLSVISRAHPHLKIRQAAISALQAR